MDFKDIRKYYKEKFDSFGASAKGMDWKDQASQYIRFELISKYIDFQNNPSILDVGCGDSEFLNYCLNHKLKCDFLGIDIMKEMVDASNQKYGPNTAVLGELDSLPSNTQYDYVIASGTFNAKLTADNEAWETYFYENLSKMFSLSKKGMIFNCMTEHVDWEYDRLFYPKISKITAFINHNLSRNFIVDQSYDLFELTICTYK